MYLLPLDLEPIGYKQLAALEQKYFVAVVYF
jgi:hypothetical protein